MRAAHASRRESASSSRTRLSLHAGAAVPGPARASQDRLGPRTNVGPRTVAVRGLVPAVPGPTSSWDHRAVPGRELVGGCMRVNEWIKCMPVGACSFTGGKTKKTKSSSEYPHFRSRCLLFSSFFLSKNISNLVLCSPRNFFFQKKIWGRQDKLNSWIFFLQFFFSNLRT